MNRRDFIRNLPYAAAGIGLIVTAYEYNKPKVPKNHINLDGIEIEFKRNGILLRLDNQSELSKYILNRDYKEKLYVEGWYIAFERQKDNYREIYIPVLNDKHIKFHIDQEKFSNSSFDRPFLYNPKEFYYVGDRVRAEKLFDTYFRPHLYSINQKQMPLIMIAAPNYIEGRRDHSDIKHIWSAVSSKPSAILYRDDNTDERIIGERIRQLLDQYNSANYINRSIR